MKAQFFGDSDTIVRFPFLSPIKYTSEKFYKGETVYVDPDSWKGIYKNTNFINDDDSDYLNRKYIKVSNGTIAGFIKSEAISK